MSITLLKAPITRQCPPKYLVLYRSPACQLPRFFCRIRIALVSRFLHSRTMRGDNWTLILQETGSVF